MADETLSIAIVVEDGQLQAAVQRGNRALQTFNQTLAQTGRVANQTAQANNNLAQSSERSAAGFATQQFALGLLTAALARFASIGPSAFLEFEQASLQFQRVIVNASETGFDPIIQQFRELSQEIPISTNELTELAGVLGQLGFFGPDIIAALRGTAEEAELAAFQVAQLTEIVSNFAVAANLSGEQAAQAFGRVRNIFFGGLGIEEQTEALEGYANAVNELGNRTGASAAQVQDFVTRVGAAGANLGLTTQQISGLGAAAIEFGSTAQVAGTALQRFFGQATLRAEVFADVLGTTEQAFLQAFQADPNEQIIRFLERLNQLSLVRRNEVFAQLGAEQRLVTVLSNLSRNTDRLRAVQDLANASAEEGTSIADELAVKNQTLSSALTRLGNTITNTFVRAFETLQPIVVPIIDAFAALIDFLGPIAQVLLPVATAVTALGAAATAAVFAFNQWVTALTALRASAGSGVGPLAALQGALFGVAAGAEAAGAAAQQAAPSLEQLTNRLAAGNPPVDTFRRRLVALQRVFATTAPATTRLGRAFQSLRATVVSASLSVTTFAARTLPTLSRASAFAARSLATVGRAAGAVASSVGGLVAGLAPLIPVFLALETLQVASRISELNKELSTLGDDDVVGNIQRIQEELEEVGFITNTLSGVRWIRGVGTVKDELRELQAIYQNIEDTNEEIIDSTLDGTKELRIQNRLIAINQEIARATSDSERERLIAIRERTTLAAQLFPVEQRLAQLAFEQTGSFTAALEAANLRNKSAQEFLELLEAGTITQIEAFRIAEQLSNSYGDARDAGIELNNALFRANLEAAQLAETADEIARVRPLRSALSFPETATARTTEFAAVVRALDDELEGLADGTFDAGSAFEAFQQSSIEATEALNDRLADTRSQLKALTTASVSTVVQLNRATGEVNINRNFLSQRLSEEDRTAAEKLAREYADLLRTEWNAEQAREQIFEITADISEQAQEIRVRLELEDDSDITRALDEAENRLLTLQERSAGVDGSDNAELELALKDQIREQEELILELRLAQADAQGQVVEAINATEALENRQRSNLLASIRERARAESEARREAERRAEQERRQREQNIRLINESFDAVDRLNGTYSEGVDALRDIGDALEEVANATVRAGNEAIVLIGLYAQAQAQVAAAGRAAVAAANAERTAREDVRQEQERQNLLQDQDRRRQQAEIDRQRDRGTTRQDRREVNAAQAALDLENARNDAEQDGLLTGEERRDVANAEFEARRRALEADRSLTEDQRRQALRDTADRLRQEEQFRQEQAALQREQAEREIASQEEIAEAARQAGDAEAADAADARAAAIRDRLESTQEDDLFVEDTPQDEADAQQQRITEAVQESQTAQQELNNTQEEYNRLLERTLELRRELGVALDGEELADDAPAVTDDPAGAPEIEEAVADNAEQAATTTAEEVTTDSVDAAGQALTTSIESVASSLDNIATSVNSTVSSIESAGQNITSAVTAISTSINTFASRVNGFAAGLNSSLSTLSSAAGSISSAISGIGTRLSAIESQLASIASS